MANVPDFTGWQRGNPHEFLMDREWIVTNGLGGYASGSLAGFCTRRFHGLLIASLPAPLGRTQYVPYLEEHLIAAGRRVRLTARETRDDIELPDPEWLEEIKLCLGLPVWRYKSGTIELERRVVMPHMRNTTLVRYCLTTPADIPLQLELRPFLHMRPHEGRVDEPAADATSADIGDGRVFTCPGYPPLTIRCTPDAAAFLEDPAPVHDAIYRVERSRGYDYAGTLASPGCFRVTLAPGRPVTLQFSAGEAAHPVDADSILDAECGRRRQLVQQADRRLREGPVAQLVLAADQFVVALRARLEEHSQQRLPPDAARTIIAGYHWFTDWGRDTMIGLEGLCLLTGRMGEADSILRMFGEHVRYGLIPNMFPEAEVEGRYHTADASLWFFHALDRYIRAGGNAATLDVLLPVLCDIIDHHLRGTRFGIHVDPSDGLLVQGEEGYQLTWMDAKVGDWVVTPRRGKAVEINALFYNALMTLAGWLEPVDSQAAATYRGHAERAQVAFNRRFWNPALGYLYDVVDAEHGGDDASLRPNQIFAIALAHPVLAVEHWKPVVDTLERELLTPAGLRTLSPDHPNYKPFYDGDLRARDAAYHQGTVWPWLIGPFMDAWLKVYGDATKAQKCIAGLYPHLTDGCIGTISEVFDAESPYKPRGCAAQAWSVAELIRVTALLAADHEK